VELKGNIDEYGVADIFQLIGQQARSGVLTIRSSKKSIEVIFVEGMISRSHPAYYTQKQNPLGECGLKARLITEKNLQKAIVVQERTMKPLEDVLMDLKFLDQIHIQKLYDFLLWETLYEALQWKSGDYEFVAEDIKHDERFSDLVSVDHILLDVLRMIDEEPDLLRRIASYSITFQKVETNGGSEPLPIHADGDDEETYEDIVWGLVNGENTVQDIIDQSLLGRYHTLNALISLIDSGKIRKSVTAKIAPQKPVIRERRLMAYVSCGIIPILVLAIIALRGGATVFPAWHAVQGDVLLQAQASSRLARISNALNAYCLCFGEFPLSLEKLVEDGLLAEEDLIAPGGSQYRYARLNETGSFRIE